MKNKTKTDKEKIDAYNKRTEYLNNYQKVNLRRYGFSVSRSKQAHIIEFLNQKKNIQEYIISLIEQDMNK